MIEYKGKEPCQGCGKTGIEMPRTDKNKLCKKCVDQLQIGRIAEFEQNEQYILVFQHFYAYRPDVLNNIVHDVLRSVSNPNVKRANGHFNIKYATGNNGIYYRIPERFYEVIIKLMTELQTRYNELSEREKQIPIIVSAEIEKERNEIYNAGVAKGRDLLFQLNTGGITMDDFNEKLIYTKK